MAMPEDPILLGSSKVTSRGQITIPKDLRKKFDIGEGDTIYFLGMNGEVQIKKGPLKLWKKPEPMENITARPSTIQPPQNL